MEKIMSFICLKFFTNFLLPLAANDQDTTIDFLGTFPLFIKNQSVHIQFKLSARA
jgi:hypothetical protein